MILSVSRRTDIPAFYSDWFINRIKEKYVLVRNPMNFHMVSKINLSPHVVDCIVFWSKNPKPIMDKLDYINDDYNYYFQFTLNSYDKDIEKNLPNKKKLIETFKDLSLKLGKKRVVWRYDPIFINHKYTLDFHIKAFEKYANLLNGYTDTCVISFIDIYKKISAQLREHGITQMSEMDINVIAKAFSEIGEKYNITIKTCSENINLERYNIYPSSCIDGELIEKIIGTSIIQNKDKNQRLECGCMESIDIGFYNTCSLGCVYCYANYSSDITIRNFANYNPTSPLLCSNVSSPLDIIKERATKSFKKL